MYKVEKLYLDGRVSWSYPAVVLARTVGVVWVEAYFNRDDMDTGYTVFKRGDRLVETFYAERWYNVFAVYDRDDGGLKGWYCNVCRPAEIGATAVRYVDLALDVWVYPSGEALVLDEDEFAALELSAEERAAGRAGLDALLALAGRGLGLTTGD